MGEIADELIDRMCFPFERNYPKGSVRFDKRNDFPQSPNRAKYWIQKDGTPIKIKKMGDGHLLNTILLLERRMKDMSYSDKFRAEWSVSYTALEAERIKRKLPQPLLPIVSLEWRRKQHDNY